MKTAISIPDELFRQADEYARHTGTSRSELYRVALRDYLARHDAEAIRRSWAQVADAVDTSLDDWGRAAARATLERSEW